MNMYRILLVLALLMSNNVSAFVDNSISVDSRIKTFVYSPNEVFAFVFSQGYYSCIEFAKGEKVKNIAVGDAASWQINPSDNKLFIMPFEASGKTNMIITTTKKRNYVFDLIARPNYNKQSEDDDKKVSDKKGSHDYSAEKDMSYIIRFYYPQDEDEFDMDVKEFSPSTQAQYVSDQPEKVIEENDTKYNYTYIDDGDNEDIVPIELFDDGYLTYFKFRDNNKIPQILIELGEVRSPCKRLLLDDYIIIKGVHKKLFMRYEDNEVEIINKSL
ncbi:MAG: Type IV secretion system protein virB9 [Wolbachia endosymbiont of Ctenocephalides orientis wCori]|nr:MAG: Type IV secretion system protein virB9 [Wolbachia endosymbiont of Ctenocephalides orientis wCori]